MVIGTTSLRWSIASPAIGLALRRSGRRSARWCVRLSLGRFPKDCVSDDWVNIIDVDAWHTDRPWWQSDRPVIGRHSRPSPQKWPTDPKIIEAVYPVDGSAIVRILGGADPVRDVLGYVPESWQVMPFGAVDPREFLAQLDFFVYYHHPAWVEAFGRNILEAMASGLPAILPPHFRRLFGDSAIYAEPAEVPSVVSRLYGASVERTRRHRERARNALCSGAV